MQQTVKIEEATIEDLRWYAGTFVGIDLTGKENTKTVLKLMRDAGFEGDEIVVPRAVAMPASGKAPDLGFSLPDELDAAPEPDDLGLVDEAEAMNPEEVEAAKVREIASMLTDDQKETLKEGGIIVLKVFPHPEFGGTWRQVLARRQGKLLRRNQARVNVAVSDRKGGDRPIEVGVNGVMMLIPRGEDCWIWEEYHEALNNAIEFVYETDENGAIIGRRESRRHPFQMAAPERPAA